MFVLTTQGLRRSTWVHLVFRVLVQNANKYLILFLREARCAWRGCVILDLHRQVGKPLRVEWLRGACSLGISAGFSSTASRAGVHLGLPGFSLRASAVAALGWAFSFISSQGLACPDILNAPRAVEGGWLLLLSFSWTENGWITLWGQLMGRWIIYKMGVGNGLCSVIYYPFWELHSSHPLFCSMQLNSCLIFIIHF